MTRELSIVDPNACTVYTSEFEATYRHPFYNDKGEPLRDKKGRAIGVGLAMTVRTHTDAAPGVGRYNVPAGVYYALHTTATRNGEDFGPAFNWTIYRTREERAAAIEKYLKGAEARARKTAVNRTGEN